MAKLVPGPPYVFRCSACKHTFTRRVPFGLLCPKCHSLRVVPAPVLK